MGQVVPLEVLEMMGAGLGGMLSIPSTGRTFICGPVYHSAQWAFSFLPMMTGSQIVMRHKFDAADALRVIDEHKITNVHLVPTQFRRMLKLDEATRKDFDGSSLEVVWQVTSYCMSRESRQRQSGVGPETAARQQRACHERVASQRLE